MNFAIMQMQPEDWEAVRSIYQEGIATEQATFETDAPEWAAWDKSHLRECRFVARSDEGILGWAALSPVSSRCVYAGVAEASIYVRASARGQGIGKALLWAVIEESERIGIWTLQGGVFPENTASIALQKACGFREVGRRERLGQMNGVWRDVLLMERRSPGVETRSDGTIRRMTWFDRAFPQDHPLWMYPNMVERVRGTPVRLADRVGSLPREILTRRDGEKWSIQENAGHLLDLESLWLGRLDDFAAGHETLEPADLQNRKTCEANHNSESIQDILNSFRSARLRFVARLDGFDNAFIQRTALHPRLRTPMRVLDLVFFVAEHDDHHLARMTELIRIFREGSS